MQPMIIVLKEGTDSSQGKSQILSSISACQAVAETIRTTLGPRGMDKLIVDNRGKATISNDGATILKLLEIVHPAARTLVDIAKSQDAEVGDGTTSVVLLAAEILQNAKTFIEDGMHSTIIIRALRKATALATKKVKEISINVKSDDAKLEFNDQFNMIENLFFTYREQRALLEKCACTTLSSKLIARQRDFFAKMVVDAVLMLDELLPLNMYMLQSRIL